MDIVTNTIEDRAKAIYTDEVLSCGSGMMPEWEQLDAQGKTPWLDRAQDEVGAFMAKTAPCSNTPHADEMPVVTTDNRREHEVLVKACIIRGQQLYEDSKGTGASWDRLSMAHKLQWVALAQAEFLSAHAQMSPRQFLTRCGEDASWR